MHFHIHASVYHVCTPAEFCIRQHFLCFDIWQFQVSLPTWQGVQFLVPDKIFVLVLHFMGYYLYGCILFHKFHKIDIKQNHHKIQLIQK